MRELRISGPGKNALSSALMESLTQRLQEANGEPLLLTGEGDAFCAGLDLKEVASLDAPGMTAFLGRLERLLEALYFYPGPTVALVNGHAIAGGCLLSLFCDYRVARANPKTKIGLNEVALGLRFPPRALRMVQRLLSPRDLERVILEGALYSPEGALKVGLIDEVAEEAERLAKEKLEALAKLPREAYAANKQIIREVPPTSPQDEAHFQTSVVPSWIAPALKQKLLAVLGK